MQCVVLPSRREASFNSPDLGDIKGRLELTGWDPSFPILAPFFDTLLGVGFAPLELLFDGGTDDIS